MNRDREFVNCRQGTSVRKLTDVAATRPTDLPDAHIAAPPNATCFTNEHLQITFHEHGLVSREPIRFLGHVAAFVVSYGLLLWSMGVFHAERLLPRLMRTDDPGSGPEWTANRGRVRTVLVAALVVAIVLGVLVWAKRLFDIDRCLDRGGRWDDRGGICEL